MDRAAEGLVESVIKTYVSVLIPPWGVCARALASNAIPLHGCSPLLTALPSKQLHQHSSVISETTLLAWLLIDHCRAYTGQRRERIVCAWLQSPLNSLGNSSVQWPQTRCSSTLNEMFLSPPVWGPWQRDHGAFLDVVPVGASQANPQSLMIHLQWSGFLFPTLRVGMSEFWFVSP